MKIRSPMPLCLIAWVMILTGCGSFPVTVTHSPLPAAPHHNSKGTVLVQTFVDARPVQDQHHVGEANNTAGLPCGPIVDSHYRTVADILTDHFAAALRAAGYQTLQADTNRTLTRAQPWADAVLEGQIRECWLTTSVGAISDINVKVTVRVRLRQPQTGELLHEKTIAREAEYRTSWRSALKRVLDEVLREAVLDFASAQWAPSRLDAQQTAAR